MKKSYKKNIVNIIKYYHFSDLSRNKLKRLKKSELLKILCDNYTKIKPTCYSFLQAIFTYLYDYFIDRSVNETYIINCFFPQFQSGKYKQYSYIPNINLLNYNKMLTDYRKHHYKEYMEKYRDIIDTPSNEDYQDLIRFLYFSK